MRSLPIDRKNILVVGGAGFLGSHLCERLVREANVICVDNFSTGSPQNLERLLQDPCFELVRQDVNAGFDLANYPELDRFHVRVQGVQEIYFLASPLHHRDQEGERLAMLQTHSVGLLPFLEIAARYNATFVLASSSEVYEPSDEAFLAEDAPLRSHYHGEASVYAEAKRFAEVLATTSAQVRHFPLRIARLFDLYGPRIRIHTGHLIPDLIQAALDGQEVTIEYVEDERMSFCHVKDAVDGLLALAAYQGETLIMNIGSDQDIRLSVLVDRLSRLAGQAFRVRYSPRATNRAIAFPDLTKARQLLHWIPLIRLEEGLVSVFDYARSKRQQTSTFGY